MTSRILRTHFVALLALTLFLSCFFQTATAEAAQRYQYESVVIRGKIHYSVRKTTSFKWTLTLHRRAGLIVGTGTDRNGAASFFGTYDARTGRIRVVKHYRSRRTGMNKFYYSGKIRGSVLTASATMNSFSGKFHGRIRAKVVFVNRTPSDGTPIRFSYKATLSYLGNSRKKPIRWNFKVYNGSGRIYGVVRDRDGAAILTGVMDKKNRRVFIRKKYSNGRTFYYKGTTYPAFNRAWGTAHKTSFLNPKSYGTFSGKMTLSGTSRAAPTPRRRLASLFDSPRKLITVRGKIRTLKGGRTKAFVWKIRYYWRSKRCYGTTKDRLGKATLFGDCDFKNGRLKIKKTYANRTSEPKTFYFLGRVRGNTAKGVARMKTLFGRRYATWSARITYEKP